VHLLRMRNASFLAMRRVTIGAILAGCKKGAVEMKNRWGLAIIVAALIWAAVILASSSVLDGSSAAARVLTLQGGGAAATIILLGGLAIQEKR
jgi:hypothetical protein